MDAKKYKLRPGVKVVDLLRESHELTQRRNATTWEGHAPETLLMGGIEWAHPDLVTVYTQDISDVDPAKIYPLMDWSRLENMLREETWRDREPLL